MALPKSMISSSTTSAASIWLRQILRHEPLRLNICLGTKVRNGNCYCGKMSAVRSCRCTPLNLINRRYRLQQQVNPKLRGKPIAVIGSGGRTVITTRSYEPRAFGVKGCINVYEARTLCPYLINEITLC
jgi:hypothetical protein